MKCIYCLGDKPISSFEKVEHVIPQSFGVFENNLTLHNTVCDSCNQYFGDNIEIALARDSIEGASRFEFQLREPNEFKSFGRKSRMVIKVAEGDWKGAYAYREYSEGEEKVIIKPLPQVGLLKANSPEYEYHLLNDVPAKEHLDKQGFDLSQPKSIRIVGTDVETATTTLNNKGIAFKVSGETPQAQGTQTDFLCRVEATIDQTIFRAVSKIAFNYLAYWEGPDFVLHDNFGPTREFIRKGVKAKYPLVRATDEAILGDEPVQSKRRLGHIVTLNWALDKVSIVSQVSLLNLAKYSVSLAADFAGEKRNITRGHFFSINDHKVFELETRTRSLEK